MQDHFDPNSEAVNQLANTPLMLQLAAAEFNQQVTTARAFPRSPARVANAIKSLATMEGAAQGCVYSIPRKERGVTKQITGPSVRLAEMIASCWGNCNVGARIVAVDRMEKVVIVEGVFWDLESGMKRVEQVQRRISTSSGGVYTDDMITVTANAAMSIATRNAILKSVPRAVWKPAYDAAFGVIAGDVKSLDQNRAAALKHFVDIGVSNARVFAALEVGGALEIGIDQLVALRGMAEQIKDGESSIDALFPTEEEAKARAGAEKAALRAAVVGGAAKAEKAATAPATPQEGAKAAPEAAAAKEAPTEAVDEATGEVIQEAEVVSETSQTHLALDAPPKKQPLTATAALIVRDMDQVMNHGDLKELQEAYAAEIAAIEKCDPELSGHLDAAFDATRNRLNG
jgi:hypothetical protein